MNYKEKVLELYPLARCLKGVSGRRPFYVSQITKSIYTSLSYSCRSEDEAWKTAYLKLEEIILERLS